LGNRSTVSLASSAVRVMVVLAGLRSGLRVDAERAEDAGVDPRGVDQGGRGPRPLDVREQLRTVAAEVMAALKG